MKSECYSYTGVCLEHLQTTAATYGIPTPNGVVQVVRNPSLSDHDTLVSQFVSNSIVSDACQSEGLPFLCNYFYILCNGSDGSTVTISNLVNQCIDASQGSCQMIWQLAMSFNLVPDCRDVDSGNSESTTSMSTTSSMTSLLPTITCHPEFELRCGVCVPLCKEFNEIPEDIQKSIDVLFIIASCLIVIGGVFVIFVSIVRREVM